MSVKSCEKIEKSQVVLTIEVGAPEFEAAIEKAYQKMRKKINVPGFRPGKAPRKIIEGMYGAEVFFEEAINIAFPEAYEAAVKEQELQVVGYPSVEIEGQVTNEYAEDALARTEEAVQMALDEVKQQRVRFRSASAAKMQEQRDKLDGRTPPQEDGGEE